MYKIGELVETMAGTAKVVKISLMCHGYGVKWYATAVLKSGGVVFIEN
jgi:hypothetical protein